MSVFAFFFTKTHLHRASSYFIPEKIYTSEKKGNDAEADGTEDHPFKTVLAAMLAFGKEPFPTILVDSKVIWPRIALKEVGQRG